MACTLDATEWRRQQVELDIGALNKTFGLSRRPCRFCTVFSNYPTGTINLYIELYQNFPRVAEFSSTCVSTRL